MPPSGAFAFGPFVLDTGARRLVRDDVTVLLNERQIALLCELVSRAGEVVPKNVLVENAWEGAAVSDNSLAQAISHLRVALDPEHPRRYIENRMGRGYVFITPVRRVEARRSDEEIAALLAPYRALVEGRAAIESLRRAQIDQARATFEALVLRDARDAGFHVGLANACLLQFESTRADAAPDTDALRLAIDHAHEACRLTKDLAEAYATLGFVLSRSGQGNDAIAALRHAVALQPNNWTHHLRLAAASWGEARLRAAERTLELLPDCAQAHWLAATVYVARGALVSAQREIDAGLATLETGADTSARFAPVALHWLAGLLHLAQGHDDQALAAFEREVAGEERGHVYAREICANARYAAGACRLARGETALARAAFTEALARIPQHPLARAGMAIVEARDVGRRGVHDLGGRGGNDADRVETKAGAVEPFESTLARAALLVADGRVAAAVSMVGDALASAPSGNAGWLVPIEPLLGVRHARSAWTPVLTMLGARAS